MPRDFKETYAAKVLSASPGATYLEIGVRWGESMRAVRAQRKIGVDPVRHASMTTLRDGEEFHEMTSDEFFATRAAEVLRPGQIDAALVDGYHEFEQTLRDVINLEPFMAQNGLMVIDDCNPLSRDRAVDQPTGGVWNGDVWKVAAFIKNEFRDLHFATVDADQGVGLLWGFGDRTTPRSCDPELVSTYKALDYSALEANRREMISLVPSRRSNLRRLGVPPALPGNRR